MKRLVIVLEAFALVASLVFVIMLFANEPAAVSGASGGSGGSGAPETPGAALYRSNCASCHGADGGGAIGPKLAGVATTKFPNIDDQIAVVTNGRDSMPSFRGNLTPDQIRQVVEYTRTELGTTPTTTKKTTTTAPRYP